MNEHQEEVKKHCLSICSLFTNEEKYLAEWLEYHLLIGVEHFYLYNNESDDEFEKVLEPYIKDEVVTLINWPSHECNPYEELPFSWSLGIQTTAYENAIKCWASKESEWLVFLGVDEYLVPTKEGKITDLLKKNTDASAIFLTSDCFNAYDIDFVPRKKLISEMTTLTPEPKQKTITSLTKMIFKPALSKGFSCFPYQPILESDAMQKRICRNELRINKYVNRFKGNLRFDRDLEKICFENASIPNDVVKAWLRHGYETEDREKAIERFVPDLISRLRKPNNKKMEESSDYLIEKRKKT